jgi:hypothetical protein
MQSGIFLVRYWTKIQDAGMPMPALVSYADIHDQRYRTEPDIGISDIGLRERSPTLYLISE